MLLRLVGLDCYPLRLYHATFKRADFPRIEFILMLVLPIFFHLYTFAIDHC